MKIFMALIVCVFLLSSQVSHAGKLTDTKFKFNRDDTQAHLWLSYAVSLTMTEVMEKQGLTTKESVLWSSLAVGSLSLVKEFLIDDEPSGNDLIADGLGLCLNALVQFTIRF